MKRTLTIGVLETGRPPEEFGNRFKSYPEMIADWLEVGGETIRSYAVLDGVFPASVEAADLWVITGSRFGVYEDHAFIPVLEDFIRECRFKNRKMVGICFGHQIIAQAMGGSVERASVGWGVGVHSYHVMSDALSAGFPLDQLVMQCFHRDQVVDVPVGARGLATSKFCPVGALWYPGWAISFQGHPEFGTQFMRELLMLRRGSLIATDMADRALVDIDQPGNSHALGCFVKELDDW